MTDKPLHVQVAEALGWQRCYLKVEFTALEMYKSDDWRGFPPGRSVVSEGSSLVEIPRYDLDWAVTGPLIEKYGILVGKFPPYTFDGKWYACLPGSESPYVQAEAHAPTPLVAVCNLILQLHKTGKLTTTVQFMGSFPYNSPNPTSISPLSSPSSA